MTQADTKMKTRIEIPSNFRLLSNVTFEYSPGRTRSERTKRLMKQEKPHLLQLEMMYDTNHRSNVLRPSLPILKNKNDIHLEFGQRRT